MKIKNLLFALLAVVAIVGCKREEPVVEPVLEVSSAELKFAAVSDEKVIYITANNDWSLEADVNWISFNQESGTASEEKQMVKVYADDNKVQETRSGKITITSGKLTKTVSVTQAAAEPEPEPVPTELTISETTLAAGAEGAELTFTITSNKAWTAVAEAEWVSIEPASGDASEESVAVKVTVTANDSYEERTASIKVTAEEVEETIALTQDAKELPPPPAEMEGDGTEANPYQIRTAAHLAQMREKALAGGETWFVMVSDIDMAGITDYVPVNYDGDFDRKVHFDGGNYTISNFSYDKAVNGANYGSIFGVLYGSCRNLKVDNATIVATNGCGVIGGYVGTAGKPALVENVTITNSSVTNSGDRCGGVCGTAKEATFKNVFFQGTVTSTIAGEAKSGGFVGQTETSATFENCSVDVVFAGAGTDIGGFAGKLLASNTFKGCKVKVTITSSTAQKNRCGGFLGWNSSASATFEDCHVLSGSSVRNVYAGTASVNGNFGGFIGYGDTTNSVVEIKNCSAQADVDGGVTAYNSCFVSCFGYVSTVTITDSYARGDLKTSTGNYTGGLVGQSINAGAVLKISGCYYEGNIEATGGYVGGLIGGATGKVEIKTSYSAGTVVSKGSYVGGLIGASMNDAVTITDCFSTAKVSAWGQQVGGLVGTTTNKLTMTNCYASGDIYSATSGAAGLVGRVATSSSITNCIAWNKNVSTSRTANNLYAPGAILGCAQAAGTYSGCWRRYDMVLVDEWISLYDQPDYVNATPPLPSYSIESHQQAYHGKAAAPDATIASVAQSLGWDSSVWDFTSGGSSLGFTIKQLGDNKIEF